MIRKKIGTLLFCVMMSAQPALGDVVDRIVAIVNDDIITLVQLNKAVAPYKIKIEASDYALEKKKAMIEKLERDLLHQMIDRSLASQAAERYFVSVSEKEVDAALENMKKQNKVNQEQFEKALAAEGLLLADYRERIRQDILQSRLINRAVRSKAIVTESEIKAYYEVHIKEFQGIRKYKLRNILFKDEDQAALVLKQIEKGASFKAMAKKYSIASNGSDGGDLGTFDINNFSETVKNAVKTLKKGECSRVIGTGQGAQIIFVEDILQEGSKTYEQVHDEIQKILYKKVEADTFAKWIESLKENAHVKIML